jgi:hypothetical protein
MNCRSEFVRTDRRLSIISILGVLDVHIVDALSIYRDNGPGYESSAGLADVFDVDLCSQRTPLLIRVPHRYK